MVPNRAFQAVDGHRECLLADVYALMRQNVWVSVKHLHRFLSHSFFLLFHVNWSLENQCWCFDMSVLCFILSLIAVLHV